jgi:hypothetical protein
MKYRIALFALLLPCIAHAQLASEDGSEVASLTFVKACVGYMGAYGELREQLRPGKDLALPQLSPADAKPFLAGHEGDVWVRPDYGVALALFKEDDSCTVFMTRGSADRLYNQLLKDLKAGLGRSFSVTPAGQAAKGTISERYVDLAPIGEYRAEWIKRYGNDPETLRVTLGATSGGAGHNLKAIVTLGAKP